MIPKEATQISDAHSLKALEQFVVENDDLLALESLIGKFNIFDALGIPEAEIRHSNFLAFMLDPAESHGLGQLFLKALLMDLLKQAPLDARPCSPIDLDGTDLRGVEIRREWNHIDVLIACKQPPFFVVIENKVRAHEGPGQLTRYENVMKRYYPGARPLYVYLTLTAEEPAENKWMPYRHADIYRVFKRVQETYRKAIGQDVLVFLEHYLNLIGTRFMHDSLESQRIEELCAKIYKTHRQALDSIWERVGTPTSGVITEVRKVLEADNRWDVEARLDALFFTPRTWLEWLPPLGTREDPQRWIYVLVYARNGKLSCALDMSPLKDPKQQGEIITQLLNENPDSGLEFRRPKSHSKDFYKNNFCRITATDFIAKWDEDDEPDAEEIHEATKRKLNELYPQLERLGVLLKALSVPRAP